MMELKYGKVSIIMRTKNRNIFLKRAIQDVINQTYEDWILVIVNDGGNKKEVDDLVNSYSSIVKKTVVIHNEESIGMEAASNKGINSVNSDFVVIHDDDDTWESDFLKVTVGYLESNLECQGAITHSNKVIEKIKNNQYIKVKKIRPFNTYLHGMIDICEICSQNLFSPISFIYRRKVFEKIGFYDESLPVLGDWEFNLRFIREFDIHVIERRLANYHQRPKVKKGEYSNSIVGGRDTHLHYQIYLKNKLLRNDLRRNNLNMGIISSCSQNISLYKKIIHKIENISSNITIGRKNDNKKLY